MSEPSGASAGLMILRVWIEPGGSIRVRITRTTDVESGQSTTSYASAFSEVISLVESWLDEAGLPRPGVDTADRK